MVKLLNIKFINMNITRNTFNNNQRAEYEYDRTFGKIVL